MAEAGKLAGAGGRPSPKFETPGRLPPQTPWREIFWGLWSLLNVLWCYRCHAFFPACELPHCSVHPEPPLFLAGRGR